MCKKTILILGIVCSIIPNVYSQSKVDSLLFLLQNAEKEANIIAQIDACAELGYYYNYRNADSTRYFAQKGLKLNNRNDNEYYCIFSIMIAESIFESGDMKRAEEYYKEIYNTVKNNENINNSNLIDICGALGVLARRNGDIDAATKYYNEAIELAILHNNYDSQTNIYTSIAILYAGLKRFDESLNYTEKAVEAGRKGASIEQQIYANSSRGSIQCLANRYEEAIETLRNNYNIAKNIKSSILLVKSTIPLIQIFSKLNMPDSVYHYDLLVQPALKEISKESVEYLGYIENQANVYVKIGDFRRANLLHEELLNYPNNIQTPLSTLHYRIAENLSNLGDFKKAYKNMQIAYNELDSLTAKQIHEQLSEMNVKFETKEKELKIITLEQDKMLRTTWFAVGMLLLSIIIIVLLLVNRVITRRKIRLEENIRNQKSEYDSLQRNIESRLAKEYISGLESERARLAKELHDGVCNDLLGLQININNSNIDTKIQQNIDSIIDKTRNDVRDISHALMPPQFLHATVDQILYDLTLRWGDKFDNVKFAYKSDNYDWGKISNHIAYELYRITQEVLSNIFKYSHATTCNISLSTDGNHITLTILNNGTNLQGGEKGIGAKTLKERVKSINGEIYYKYNDNSMSISVSFVNSTN